MGSSLIDGLKEFIWDILGYFIPGFFFMSFIVFFFESSFFEAPLNVIEYKDSVSSLLILVVSYLLGHLLYGISMVKDQLYRFFKYDPIDQQKRNIMKSEVFETTKRNICAQTGVEDTISINDLRSIILSSNKGLEKITYTFRFRSDICHHLETIALLIIGSTLIDLLLDFVGCGFLRPISGIGLIIFAAVIVLYPLQVARSKFYAISMKIPFTLLLKDNNPDEQ